MVGLLEEGFYQELRRRMVAGSPKSPGNHAIESDEEAIILGGHAGIAGLSWEEVLDAFPVIIRYLMASHRRTSEGVDRAKIQPILLKPPGICLHGLDQKKTTLVGEYFPDAG
jgi:hypothetical protein